MSSYRAGPSGPEVEPCSYEGSRLVFRAPARRLSGRYVAALGGAETFGKGTGRPWPARLESATGLDVVNFGAVGAGPDAVLQDDMLLAASNAAAATILQVSGVQGLSNALYRVHPRRNDRFVRALPPLQDLYPEVDFCDYSFTRHLLGGLHRRDPVRFAHVSAVLQANWRQRMEALIDRLGRPVILLWLGDRLPEAEARLTGGTAPLLVTRPMLDSLRPRIAALVEVANPSARVGGQVTGLPGCAAHEGAARAVLRELEALGLLPEPLPKRA
jgi:hypothetical protein